MVKGVRLILSVVIVAVMSLTVVWGVLPDNENILKETTTRMSENYYPNLMLRFDVGDTTLTLQNYHYLYYGYAYQDGYQPLATNPEMDRFLLLAAGLDADAPNVETLRRIVVVGRSALKYDPFNLKVWNMLAYAYGALGEKKKEREAYDRVEKIVTTIKATGDGLKEGSAQHVLMFDHALDIMAMDNLIHTKPMIISRTVEYIPLVAPVVSADKQKVRGLYFDFGRVYWNKPDSVTYKRDRTWQFNNLKPREYK